jgi:hypothetical protein
VKLHQLEDRLHHNMYIGMGQASVQDVHTYGQSKGKGSSPPTRQSHWTTTADPWSLATTGTVSRTTYCSDDKPKE